MPSFAPKACAPGDRNHRDVRSGAHALQLAADGNHVSCGVRTGKAAREVASTRAVEHLKITAVERHRVHMYENLMLADAWHWRFDELPSIAAFDLVEDHLAGAGGDGGCRCDDERRDHQSARHRNDAQCHRQPSRPELHFFRP